MCGARLCRQLERQSPMRMVNSQKFLLYAAAVAVLLGVFSLYIRPEFLVMLANQVWACF